MGTSLGELGRRFNQARSAGGLGFALAVSVMGAFVHPAVVAIGLTVAVYNRAETYYRNRHPDTPVLAVLVADTIVAGVSLLFIGPIPEIVLSMYAYVLITSMFWVTRSQVLLVGLTLSGFVMAANVIPDYVVDLGPNRSLLIGATVAAFAAFTLWMADAAARSIRASNEIERQALAKEREANAMKDQFVSMISHELRTPITSLIGFAETLEDAWGLLDETETKEFLSIMHGEATHLKKLVEDILLIPGLEAGRLPIEHKEFPISEVVDSVVRAMFSEGSEWKIKASVPPVTLLADPGRTQQILRNILRNAQKYGGPKIELSGTTTREHLLIRITDNGGGIPADSQEKVFEAFEQLEQGHTRNQGLGLGLAISRALAQAMGGDVWYESGDGATFVVKLPLAEEEPLLAA